MPQNQTPAGRPDRPALRRARRPARRYSAQAAVYKNRRPLWLFLLPAFTFMGIYLFYPFFRNIVDSFQVIEGLGMPAKGLNDPWYLNYSKMLTDPVMRTAVLNTLLLMLCTLVFQVGMALLLALLVDRAGRGAGFFRTVYFFPIVISATALGLLFNLIFLYDGGMLNQLLQQLNWTSKNIDWKGEKFWFSTMTLPVMWQYVGYYFVIILTGLNNIPAELYEAAAIDGAGPWQLVRYIKWPLLHNTLCTCLTLAITGALKVFDLPWTMMPNGMPLDKSWLTGTYMYKQTMLAKDVDYAGAIGVFIVLLGVLLSQLSQRIFRERDE
ncbi:sugar ABC transporter permease [Oscillospiraceae bacterium HV4-5-C5C]|nr:sugar ABC transporter permease [Oscillospiraceae bacterium HV4-5-C5C]